MMKQIEGSDENSLCHVISFFDDEGPCLDIHSLETAAYESRCVMLDHKWKIVRGRVVHS